MSALEHLLACTHNASKREMVFVISPHPMIEADLMKLVKATVDTTVGAAWDGDDLVTHFYVVESYDDGVAKAALVAALLGSRIREPRS